MYVDFRFYKYQSNTINWITKYCITTVLQGTEINQTHKGNHKFQTGCSAKINVCFLFRLNKTEFSVQIFVFIDLMFIIPVEWL